MWFRNFAHDCCTVGCPISTYKPVSVTISRLFIAIQWGAFPLVFCQIHQIFTVPFLFIFLLLFKEWPSSGFPHDAVAKCTDVSQELPVSILRVTTAVEGNAEAMHCIHKCVRCITMVQNVWPVKLQKVAVALGIVLSWVAESCWSPRPVLPLFSHPTCRICGHKLGSGCGLKTACVQLQWAWLPCGWVTTGPVHCSVTLELEADRTYGTSDSLTAW
jgi:hypothetical protein